MEKQSVKNGRVTIRTVAEDAGVSVAAVSKVLRNAYGVSEGLRARVQESIARLGYRPSTAARGMRGQTYTIGVLVIGLNNPFIPMVVEGINTMLDTSNYRPMLSVGQARFPLETALIDSMIDFRMDGLILIAPRLAGDLLADYARRIPIVVIGHHEPDAVDFDTVNSDDYAGGRLATESLIAGGHREIHMLSLQPADRAYQEVFHRRETGYLDAMREAGLAERSRIFPIGARVPDIFEQFETFIAKELTASAVFCWSDMHAIPFIDAAHASGIAIPEKLAIIGYDNTPVGGLHSMGLSSIDQHGDSLGQLAAKILVERIEGRIQAEHHLIAPTLVRRKSF